ncbi:MAG: ABC transporter substrate-binding protein [Actinobacteria bacterium]|nr:ABC transporter substrate-binding protein [Actinomycetota bacterium]
MKRTSKMLVTAVAAAAVALGSLAASGSAGAQSSARGVTDSSIKVSGLGHSAFYEEAGKAAKARFDLANKNNEIPGGRKIDYIGFTDDKANGDTNLAETRRLVTEEQVFGIVPVMSPSFQAAGAFVNQSKVPTLGWGISSAFCDSSNKYIFGFTGCLVPNPPTYPGNTWGELMNQYFKNQGVSSGAKGKTTAIIADNNDSGKTGVEVIVATAEAVGMKVVYAEAALPAPPAPVGDFAPYVQAIMTSNNGKQPDVVFLVVAPSNVYGLGPALTQAGFTGVDTNAVAYAPAFAALTKGWQAFTQFATPESTSSEMQQINQTLQAAGIQNVGQPGLAGYFAADMFVQILKKVGKDLTPEKFQAVAAKFKYQIENVVGPTYYPAGFKAGSPCGQLSESNGSTYKVTAEFGCYDLLTEKGNKWVTVPYPKGVK